MNYKRTEEVLLDVKGVHMQYGPNVILRDVNATIHKFEHSDKAAAGRIICFLGPSGIGKTQLSRIITGLLVPTSGQVLLHGGVPVSAGQVCMVPQAYPMFDYLTVGKNIKVAGKVAKLTDAQIDLKATALIDEFGLRESVTKYPRDLSGGTKQRVAIVRQMMCTGHYMVMDEPFSGLDPASKKAAMDAIIRLGALDAYNTIIIVTHDIASGLAVSDKVWLMGREAGLPGGRIVKEIDLAEMDLAWQPDIKRSKKFQDLVLEIESMFETLKGT
jgi:ABC-type nitrate/sulfonate/bicarbonate transport system ATPase subunit